MSLTTVTRRIKKREGSRGAPGHIQDSHDPAERGRGEGPARRRLSRVLFFSAIFGSFSGLYGCIVL